MKVALFKRKLALSTTAKKTIVSRCEIIKDIASCKCGCRHDKEIGKSMQMKICQGFECYFFIDHSATSVEGLKLKDTEGYLKHHLEIAGIKEQLFSEEAILAIHQSSGGLVRKINNLAKGSLIAGAKEKTKVVSAEHVRFASTEII